VRWLGCQHRITGGQGELWLSHVQERRDTSKSRLSIAWILLYESIKDRQRFRGLSLSQ